MSTTSVPADQQLMDTLRAVGVADLRHAFPAHHLLEQTQLILIGGEGHVRDLAQHYGSDRVLPCGQSRELIPNPDPSGRDKYIYPPGPSWTFSFERGIEMLPQVTCDTCATLLVDRRNAAEEEAERLHELVNSLTSALSVLNGLDRARTA